MAIEHCLILLTLCVDAIIPITQLIIGILHKNDCPISHFLPIYLIVAGADELLLLFSIALFVCIFSS